jgi:hypothetical protein
MQQKVRCDRVGVREREKWCGATAGHDGALDVDKRMIHRQAPEV